MDGCRRLGQRHLEQSYAAETALARHPRPRPPRPAGPQGTAVYAPEKEALVWKIKNFPGGREFLLRCKFGLPSVAAEEETQGRLPPIKVKFEVRRSPGRGCEGRRPQPTAPACAARHTTVWLLLALLCCLPLPLLQIPYYSVSGALAGWSGQGWAVGGSEAAVSAATVQRSGNRAGPSSSA